MLPTHQFINTLFERFILPSRHRSSHAMKQYLYAQYFPFHATSPITKMASPIIKHYQAFLLFLHSEKMTVSANIAAVHCYQAWHYSCIITATGKNLFHSHNVRDNARTYIFVIPIYPLSQHVFSTTVNVLMFSTEAKQCNTDIFLSAKKYCNTMEQISDTFDP